MSLTPDTEPFSQAHDRVWKNLTEKERIDLSKIFTIDDVWKAAAEIQARQVKSGSLGNMNKIRPYVDGMKRYAGVIGTMVQAKPEILSFIWGPIQFLLQIASNYFIGYDKLLDAFYEIGSSLPQFEEIEETVGELPRTLL